MPVTAAWFLVCPMGLGWSGEHCRWLYREEVPQAVHSESECGHWMTPSQEMNPAGGVGQKPKGLAEVILKELTGAHVDRTKHNFMCTKSRVDSPKSVLR